MLRVLHLSGEPSDEQSRRLSELLAAEAAPAAVVERRSIGRGGTYRSVIDASLRLRRELRRFDVLHVWDATSLAVAGWLRAPRIVASFTGELPRRRSGDRADVRCPPVPAPPVSGSETHARTAVNARPVGPLG